MTHLLEVLRYANGILAFFVGIHLIVTARSATWTEGRPYVRFTRLGTGVIVIANCVAAFYGLWAGRPSSPATPLLFVGLVWAAVGSIWTMVAEPGNRRRRNPSKSGGTR